MSEICCDNSGGRVAIKVGGVTYSARSAVTVKPTTTEREAKANHDGSIYVTTKAVPAEADCSLGDRCGLDLETLMAACHVDVTIEFIDMKRTYLFTKASVVGRPEIDSETGDIKNVKFACRTVRIA